MGTISLWEYFGEAVHASDPHNLRQVDFRALAGFRSLPDLGCVCRCPGPSTGRRPDSPPDFERFGSGESVLSAMMDPHPDGLLCLGGHEEDTEQRECAG